MDAYFGEKSGKMGQLSAVKLPPNERVRDGVVVTPVVCTVWWEVVLREYTKKVLYTFDKLFVFTGTLV